MTTIHILVAEDDDNIRMGLVDILESESYQVTQAQNGEKALALFRNNTVDLVLLDIMMPEKNGYDVCRDIRAMDKQVPIIMLTAKGEEMDKVIGLHSGADDYITKPFGIHELLARITAVLRRAGLQKNAVAHAAIAKDATTKNFDACSEEIFMFGGYRVNPKTFKLTTRYSGEPLSSSHDGQLDMKAPVEIVEIEISKRELKLIQFFYQHTGQVLSRDTLLNEIWGINYLGTTRTLDQHIAKLRKKIENTPSSPKFITTVHGVGYRYSE
ncbi:response regulator transcription factor [Desulfobacula phenolica]|uniref:DNA-binding response regulator, OmpR family, contains REC and winged-helix (WHTH) domain n=1 Tax=Desulfobacula phenolica TaxID=90732 RepID=A0A1H2ELK2_9BACT|nr:response regulator transcription factor [Desulfobacula phenolica]SDT95996.1 DNA-binding response regulator, OmpR family, contains REC and winged-helix (wHTH) domain [Desulfobacula phenolica]